jgi:hypothetical protein
MALFTTALDLHYSTAVCCGVWSGELQGFILHGINEMHDACCCCCALRMRGIARLRLRRWAGASCAIPRAARPVAQCNDGGTVWVWGWRC